jgi:hypothetical protein
MAAIKSPAPDFSLPDLTGRSRSLVEFHGKVVILCFWSVKCRWSQRVDDALAQRSGEWASTVLIRVACNADDPLKEIRAAAEAGKFGIVLLDLEQTAADRYGAQVTPHFFLIDHSGVLQYRGALDNATFQRKEPGRHYLADAIRAVLTGATPDPAETPVYGCAIVRQPAE